MSRIVFAARRFRAGLVLLVSLSSLDLSIAQAQQSASPDLLPAVEVAATERAAKPQVARRAPDQPAQRRVARVPKPEWVPASSPVAGVSAANLFPTVVVSPTGIVTPTNLVASSVTVLTARDIERDQRRTASDALSAGSWPEPRADRRSGRTDVDLHARNEFQPHQGPDRRHRRQRSRQPEPFV
ncbi:hypothetical protein [Bradyrhizobium japonicum]|uniref:hypothetical protein n=1 Tax=Bradyrhizobium japonicum TaxID=375 RepID=UPI0035151BD7